MPATMEELGLHLWSAEDRRALALELMESIELESVTEDDVPDWHRAVIDQRLEEMDRNPKPRIPWDVARQQIWSQE